MKASHILVGVGALATVGILYATMHKGAKARYAQGGVMMPRPAYHPPAPMPGVRHSMPGPPPIYPSHHGGHLPVPAPVPFHRASLSGNTIYNKRVPANIKHQADNDAWDIGFPTPKTGELGPWTGHGTCIGKEKRNNAQYYGSCSYC